ncbi:MAG: pyrroline-5-carboxylate reductase [Paludibacter sp.]|jgi:pyrroline-5-carboxylate reductase|nr:pyrroline-5-carboxylate reductase [Paludibacter sp.]
MNKNFKIAITGAGNMGSAIVCGLAAGTKIDPTNIAVSDINKSNLERLQAAVPQITVATSNTEIVKNADLIILAVKPYLVKQVCSEIKPLIDFDRQIIASLAAGVTFCEYEKYLSPSAALFRIIPNTAIAVRQSVTAVASLNATPEQEKLVLDIFDELGKTYLVSENQINAYMSLSSCGIAYALQYIRAAMLGGVELGIYPETAKEIVMQTLRGAVELLAAQKSHPAAEIDKITTPGGFTIKGLNEMEANGFTNAVIKGLKASI